MLNSLEHFTVNQLSFLRGGRVELRTSRFRLSLPFQSETNQCCFLGRKLALNEKNPSSSIWPIKSKVFRALSFSRQGPSGWDGPVALCTRMTRLPNNMPLTWSFMYNRNSKKVRALYFFLDLHFKWGVFQRLFEKQKDFERQSFPVN